MDTIKEMAKNIIRLIFYNIFKILPLQNKVIATSFRGRKYGDNPQYILEAIYKINPSIRFYWLKLRCVTFEVPSFINLIPYGFSLRTIYHMATCKVYIDTHEFPLWFKKRKGQLFIETWHGGLGIKKVEGDVDVFKDLDWLNKSIDLTNKMTDVYLSQSDHLSNIYRRAFWYKGPIWKVGYPKCDILFTDNSEIKRKVYAYYNIPLEDKVLLYAPTYRAYFHQNIDLSVYDVDFEQLRLSLEKRFGSKWHILTRWHPGFAVRISNLEFKNNVIDTTSYADVQELVMVADVMLSDYSSIIFDAALRDIPCFTFATDFEAYKSERGVYYEMEELPFPYAQNNKELIDNILNYNHENFLKRWSEFKLKTGLCETGHASEDVANKIFEFFKTGKVEWK